MGKFERAIRQAATTAPVIGKDGRLPQSQDFSKYRNCPDDYRILTATNADLRTPGRFMVASQSDFTRLLRETVEYLGITSRAWHADVEHEEDHLRFAKSRGARRLYRGVQMLKVEYDAERDWFGIGFAACTVMPDWHPTKLEFALSLVHPVRPSDEDRKVALEDLGYRTIESLAQLAVQHEMLVPRSIAG